MYTFLVPIGQTSNHRQPEFCQSGIYLSSIDTWPECLGPYPEVLPSCKSSTSISLIAQQLIMIRYITPPTVPTFNSSTKCVGSPGIIHNSKPNCRRFLGMYTWMTSQLNKAFLRKLHGSFMCLAYFIWHLIHKCLYNQALADRLVQELNVYTVQVCVNWLFPESWYNLKRFHP